MIMMLTRKILLLSAIVGPCVGLSDEAKSRPFAEMHGTCSSYVMDIKNELSLWSTESHSAKLNSPIAIGEKIKLELGPATSTHLLVAPQKSFLPLTDSFAGTFYISAPASENIRVSIGAKVWVDLLESNSPRSIKAESFEMQAGCDKIFKVVVFKLKAGEKYALQFSSSKYKTVDLLVSEVK